MRWSALPGVQRDEQVQLPGVLPVQGERREGGKEVEGGREGGRSDVFLTSHRTLWLSPS